MNKQDKRRLLELAGMDDNPPSLQTSTENVLSVDVPLLTKMLQWAKEAAQSDDQINNIVKKMISISYSAEGNPLTMQDYPKIVEKTVDADNQPSIDPNTQMGMSDKQYKDTNMVKSVPVKVDVLNVKSGDNLGGL